MLRKPNATVITTGKSIVVCWADGDSITADEVELDSINGKNSRGRFCRNARLNLRGIQVAADLMDIDEEVIASGTVRLHSEDRVVLSDKLLWNRDDEIVLEGNVRVESQQQHGSIKEMTFDAGTQTLRAKRVLLRRIGE